jgi:hypothetical protein
MTKLTYPRKAEAQRKRWADPSYRERWIAGAKARWATPEHRAKMATAGFAPVSAEDHRKHPGKWSRLGVPTGYTRATAAEARAGAEEQADAAMRSLEAQGVVLADVLPDTDEAMANAALRELLIIAISPGNARTKLQAINTLLAFTKAKPTERRAIRRTSNTTDEWMQSVLQAD